MPWTEINGVRTFVAADATTTAAGPMPGTGAPAGPPGGKKSWFAEHKAATAVLTAIVVIGGATAFSGGGTPTAAGDRAGSSSSTTKDVPLTNAQKADKAADAVKGAEVTGFSGRNLEITYPLNDLGGGLGRAKIAMDTFDLMKSLKNHDVDFDTVTINGTADMLDKFGAPLPDVHAFNIDVDHDTVNRIQYGNISTGELDVLEGFAKDGLIWLHPAFGWVR
jgi:hypothetical protein